MGCVTFQGFTFSLNGQLLGLDSDGWTMRGFVGNEKQLKQRVLFGAHVAAGSWDVSINHSTPVGQLGLAAKVLKDSGSAVALARSNDMRESLDKIVESAGVTAGKTAAATFANAKKLQEHALADAKRLQEQAVADAKRLQEDIGKGIHEFGEKVKAGVKETQEKAQKVLANVREEATRRLSVEGVDPDPQRL